MPDLVDEIAADVHEAWVAHQRSLGHLSRLSPTGEQLMVPYNWLSEAAKELDRVTVRQVLYSLRLRGVEV